MVSFLAMAFDPNVAFAQVGAPAVVVAARELQRSAGCAAARERIKAAQTTQHRQHNAWENCAR